MSRHGWETRVVLAICGAAGVATMVACDPRSFDDLAGDTWVHSSEPPEGLSSRIYAVAMAASGTAPGAGASFFVTGRLEDGFAHLRYDSSGALVASRLAPSDVIRDASAVLPLDTVLVGDPASSLVAATLVSGTGAAQAWVGLLDNETGQSIAQISLGGPNSISALAFGSTGVTGGDRDIALVQGNMLTILPDISRPDDAAPIACRLGDAAGASLVLADVDPASDADEIVVMADIDSSGPPVLVVVTGALVEEAAAMAPPDGVASCFADGREPLLRIDLPEGAADLGGRMLAARFNENDIPDLVVGAPGAGGRGVVSVLLDVDAGGPGAVLEISAPPDADDFGAALAVGDLDGAAGHELVIGAPATTRTGVVAAGSVYVFAFEDGFGEPIVLADARPEAEQRFGKSVAMVPFGNDREILVVGSSEQVFTYFRTPVSSDVREGR